MAISILQMWKLTQRQLTQGDLAEALQNNTSLFTSLSPKVSALSAKKHIASLLLSMEKLKKNNIQGYRVKTSCKCIYTCLIYLFIAFYYEQADIDILGYSLLTA